MSADTVRTSPHVGAVTPSDTVDVSRHSRYYPRALYVGGGGDISVVTPDDSTALFRAAAAGSILPVQVKRVNSTGTTATSLLALY